MAFPSTIVSTLPGSPYPIHALTYSASPGSYILTGSGDKTIRLYNPFPPTGGPKGVVKAGKLVQKFEAHGYEVLDICVANDNAKFASCGGDRSVFLWDVTTAKTIKRYGGQHGHTARINTVAFAGVDDSVLVSGSFDTTVRLWDTKQANMKPLMVLSEAKDSVQAVVVKGETIMTGSVDGRVRCYDIRMGRRTTDVVGAPVTSLTMTMDGEGYLARTLDGKIRLMDRGSGGCLKTYEGAKGGEYRIKSTFGGKEHWVIGGTEADGEVVAWDMMSGEEVKRIKIPSAEGTERKKVDAFGRLQERNNVISCVAWKNSGRGRQWCCAGTDGQVTVVGYAD